MKRDLRYIADNYHKLERIVRYLHSKGVLSTDPLTINGNQITITYEVNGRVVTDTITIPGGGGTTILFYDTYDDLPGTATADELAYVRSSLGTKWLPFGLGGTYKSAGFYRWNGTAWDNVDDATFEQLEKNTPIIQYLSADYDIPDLFTTNKVAILYNVSFNPINIGTVNPGTTIDGIDPFILYPGESIEVRAYTALIYKI